MTAFDPHLVYSLLVLSLRRSPVQYVSFLVVEFFVGGDTKLCSCSVHTAFEACSRVLH